MHLVTPVLARSCKMQDLVQKPHAHIYTPSEYISVSWPPTQLSRLTFCLVFILSHTHSACTPHLCLLLSVLPTRQTSQTSLPTEFLRPRTPQCRPLVAALTHYGGRSLEISTQCHEISHKCDIRTEHAKKRM